MTERKAACVLFTQDLTHILMRKSDSDSWHTVRGFVEEDETSQEYIWRLIDGIAEDPKKAGWIGNNRIPQYFEDGSTLITDTDWYVAMLSKEFEDKIEKKLGSNGTPIGAYRYKLSRIIDPVDKNILDTIDLLKDKGDLLFFGYLGLKYLKEVGCPFC